MPHARSPLVLASTVLPALVLALLIPGGGSGGSTGPGGLPDEEPVFPRTPNPVNLTGTLQPSLLTDTTVTITPIATVTALDLTAGRYAPTLVTFSPRGL